MSNKIFKTPADMIADGKQGHIFPNGIFYRKGTTTATHQNADEYQKIILKPKLSEQDNQKITEIINDQRLMTNMLRYGMYIDQFPIIEWFSDHRFEGRMMPALLLLIQFPDLMTKDIQKTLDQIKNTVKDPTVDLIEQAINAYEQYRTTKHLTEAFLVSLTKEYISALETKHIEFINNIWSDSGCLIVPGEKKPIIGKENIINFTSTNFNNFEQLKVTLLDHQVNANLLEGWASLNATLKLDVKVNKTSRYHSEKKPSNAKLSIIFKRLNNPSIQPLLIDESFKDIDHMWAITLYHESFNYPID